LTCFVKIFIILVTNRPPNGYIDVTKEQEDLSCLQGT